MMKQMSFLELTKPSSDPKVRHWQDFFATGRANPDAPAYIHPAAKLIAYHNLDAKERAMIDAYTKMVDTSDAILVHATEQARAEGRFEGLAQGEAKGRVEERTEIARLSLAQGLDVEMVARITGLSVDQVRALRP